MDGILTLKEEQNRLWRLWWMRSIQWKSSICQVSIITVCTLICGIIFRPDLSLAFRQVLTRTSVPEINAAWSIMTSIMIYSDHLFAGITPMHRTARPLVLVCICYGFVKTPVMTEVPGVTICHCGQRSERWWHNIHMHPSKSISGCHPVLGQQHPPTFFFGHLASLAHTPGCLCPFPASLKVYE